MTPDEYIADLPVDRGAAIGTVRETILANLPEGYREEISFGTIGYVVPLERYPDTYNGQPLGYAALASHKNYMSVYLTCVYSDTARAASFQERYRATGKRLDMGKSCVRFRKLDDLPLDLLADEIASMGVDDFIARYESARSGR